MSEAEIQRLKAAASEALKEGKHPLALRHCLDLEKLQPDDPMWPRRTALVLERMGRPEDEVDALDRSAANYEKARDAFKCATICNQILRLDPSHAPSRARLRRIHQGSQVSVTPAAGPVQPVAAQWVSEQSSGLQHLPLRECLPGASQVASGQEVRAGVYQIPLADEVPDDQPLELSLEETANLPPHLAGGGAIDLTLDGRGNVMASAVEQIRGEVAGAPPPKEGTLTEDEAILAVEAELREAEQTNRALTATPLFAQLSEKSFSDLLMHAEHGAFPKDREIFRQGAPGDALYVVAEGTVGVVDEGPPRRGITKLKEGDFFGEIALLSECPRSATVVALEDVELIRIDRQVMKELIGRDPEVLRVLLRFFRDRSVERLLSSNPLFTVLSARDREALRPRFRFLEVDAGATLIAEGRPADGLLVLLAGSAEAVRRQGDQEVRIGTLGTGDVAGEMSILTESPAVATVRTTEKCFAIELPAAAFLKIVKSRPKAMDFIRRVIDRRAAQAKSILAGRGAYQVGRVDSY